jgi:hypothetical protein
MVLHWLNPPLALFTIVAPKIIEGLYRRFGVAGCLALPWITLALEKTSYDTLAAVRGFNPEREHDPSVTGGFPSGGSALPSFALLPIRGEADRLIIPFLGDKPRQAPAAAGTDSAAAKE